jgi:hypothetical protein
MTQRCYAKSAIDTHLTYTGDCNMVHERQHMQSRIGMPQMMGGLERLIDNFGNIGNSVIDSIKFDVADGYFLKMTMIDSDTIGTFIAQAQMVTQTLTSHHLEISVFTYGWDSNLDVSDAIRLGTTSII